MKIEDLAKNMISTAEVLLLISSEENIILPENKKLQAKRKKGFVMTGWGNTSIDEYWFRLVENTMVEE